MTWFISTLNPAIALVIDGAYLPTRPPYNFELDRLWWLLSKPAANDEPAGS
jgi:hypothetical protein